MDILCTHLPAFVHIAFLCTCNIKVKDMHLHSICMHDVCTYVHESLYPCTLCTYIYSQTSVSAAPLAGGKDFVAMTRRDATSTAPVPASTQLGKQQLGAISRTPPSSCSTPFSPFADHGQSQPPFGPQVHAK